MREMKVPLIESGADAFLEVLRSLPGVDYIFADVGTDHAPLVEALAKSKVFGKSFPKIITAPHEIVAAAMAMGYYCASGKPQLVLVHTVPGTLQAHGMVGNSFSAQIPFILVAGRTPITEFGVFGGKSIAIHWTQESRDQGSLIRDYVKWDFEHRTNVQLVDIVYRAYRVAMTEPRGPVYLIFPRETWSEKIDPNFEIPKRKNFEPPTSPQGDHAALRKIVRTLVDSETPVVVPDLLGRNPNAVQPLVDLCTLLSLPVTPTFTRMNYPTNDYHFVGQHGLGGQQGASSRYFKSADSLLFLDVAVPWVPELGRPRSDAKVMMMDLDPAVLTIPTWGFPIDLAVACDTNLAVRSMIEEGKRILEKEPETRRRLEERADKIAEDHRKFKKVLADDVERVSKDKPIDFVWLSHCIGKVKDADTIVLNEYDLRPNYVEFTKPNTLFGNPRLGCLGWGIGGAIGMKFAAPEKTVIATLGDGAYIAGVPTAGHFTANTYGVPVLFVIFNNQCWNASKSSTVYMYPDGFGAKSDDFPGVDLRPSPDYAGIAKACGAYGETVEDPGELESALSRALDATKRQKRQALLNVICKYPSV
ncbi:MAG: thiamine pyrophosphate-requiring protein [Nitrososphaerota archaeon]|nr:thiamine pyrophosphate-requiring protein [Nitrososphaerota archaeon]